MRWVMLAVREMRDASQPRSKLTDSLLFGLHLSTNFDWNTVLSNTIFSIRVGKVIRRTVELCQNVAEAQAALVVQSAMRRHPVDDALSIIHKTGCSAPHSGIPTLC